jgi:hypothetical protein
MEPEHVNQTPSHDFPLVAAHGDFRDGAGGLDHYGQELLAKRGQAERADQGWIAIRRVRVWPGTVAFRACDRQQRRFGAALSGRPEGALICMSSGVAE